MMIKIIIKQIFCDHENNALEFEFISSSPETKELLLEEFKSIGFYLSNHPLNEYADVFTELNIILTANL